MRSTCAPAVAASTSAAADHWAASPSTSARRAVPGAVRARGSGQSGAIRPGRSLAHRLQFPAQRRAPPGRGADDRRQGTKKKRRWPRTASWPGWLGGRHGPTAVGYVPAPLPAPLPRPYHLVGGLREALAHPPPLPPASSQRQRQDQCRGGHPLLLTPAWRRVGPPILYCSAKICACTRHESRL